MRKIVYAGANSTSFKLAEQNLKVLAEISISDSHIQELTSRVGSEFSAEDIKDSDLLEEVNEESDVAGAKIEVASISIDGGRVQIRQEDSGAGVHNPVWVETKISCMQVLDSKEHREDPHPQLPRIFLDGKSVKNIVEGIKGKTRDKTEPNVEKDREEFKIIENDSVRHSAEAEKEKRYGPKVVKRFAFATIDKSESFGISAYNKANQKHLHTAKRKAFLGDGDRKIWTIFEDNFKPNGWIPVLDFIHAVEYVWDAAKLSTDDESACWKKYIELVVHVWQGRVLTLLRRLDKTIEELKHRKKTKSIQEKIESLITIRGYFQNNYTKMNYPEYRKKGLPISSCHVESLIKQFNIRIKSTEKFWNESSVNGVLKLKASLLSDDNSWQDFWNNRYERQVSSKRNYLKAAA